jgi:redox-sensitive bicupin YhaK (pirin superfamily)
VTIGHAFRAGRSGWLQVVRGELRANDMALQAGDGLALGQVPSLELHAISASELLLFDMG